MIDTPILSYRLDLVLLLSEAVISTQKEETRTSS